MKTNDLINKYNEYIKKEENDRLNKFVASLDRKELEEIVKDYIKKSTAGLLFDVNPNLTFEWPKTIFGEYKAILNQPSSWTIHESLRPAIYSTHNPFLDEQKYD